MDGIREVCLDEFNEVIFGIVSQGYSTGSEMKRVVHRRNEKNRNVG